MNNLFNDTKVQLGITKFGSVNLKDFCIFAKEDDYIELVQWSNEQGYDITISARDKQKKIQLTIGELQAIISIFREMGNTVGDYQENW